MARVWAVLAGLEWSQHLTTAWQHMYANGAWAFLFALPRDCTLASIHTAMVCGGATPAYITPGFGPFSLAWGWLVVGVLMGALMTYAVLSFLGMLRQRPPVAPFMLLPPAPVPGPAPPAPAVSPAPAPAPVAPVPVLARTPADQAREELLEYLASGGTAALQDLAASNGMSESEFLMRSFGVSASATNSGNATYLTQRVAAGIRHII